MTVRAAHVLDGREIARNHREAVIARLKTFGRKLTLATVQVGAAKDIELYRGGIEKLSGEIDFRLQPHVFDPKVSKDDLVRKIAALNVDEEVTGVMLFSPMPIAVNNEILDNLSWKKDVEGRTFLKSHRGVSSPTAKAVLTLIESAGRSLSGLTAIVVGHSDHVGKPTAVLLMDKMATVTVCHVETRDLEAHVRGADLVVAAVGKPGVVKGDWIKPGAIVIDVGTNVVGDKLVGDVEFDAACRRAGFISPVPGGVGPLTRIILIENLIRLHEIQELHRETERFLRGNR